MSDHSATRALIQCDSAPVSVALERETWDVRYEIATVGDGADINMRIDALASLTLNDVPMRAADLLTISAYCMAADQRVDRGTTRVDVHREHWRRRLTLVIPVADPEFWEQDEVTKALAKALHFATEDTWSFVFTQGELKRGKRMLFNMEIERQLLGSPDVVILFSGGMDSLCATVEAYADLDMRPLLVSHRSAAQITGTQKHLHDRLRAQFPKWSWPWIGFALHRTDGEDSDPSQRTRAFLLAALGFSLADALGIDRVVLADNGYVSINPPISRELVGALASRGTHPTLLRLMQVLANLVFARPIRIENPLADRTRAEALNVLKRHGCAELLGETSTCGKFRSPALSRAVPHCGGCSQCVDRRFAVMRSGLEEYDPAQRYKIDIFQDELPDGEPIKIATSYVAFAQRVRPMTPEQLFEAYSELFNALDPSAADSPLAGIRLTDVLQRHSQEVIDVLGQMYGEHRIALAQGTMPPRSLLPLVSSGGIAPTQSPSLHPEAAGERDSRKPRLVKERRYWHVEFDGEKAIVDDLKGMSMLTRLLKAPGHEFRALDLMSGGSTGTKTAPEDGLSIAALPDSLIDNEAKRSIRARALMLQLELDNGVSGSRREEIRDELEQLTSYLTQAKGLGANSRRFPDDEERARTAVRKALGITLKRIEIAHPTLHQHLRDSLRTGHLCVYDPRPVLQWAIAS